MFILMTHCPEVFSIGRFFNKSCYANVIVRSSLCPETPDRYTITPLFENEMVDNHNYNQVLPCGPSAL